MTKDVMLVEEKQPQSDTSSPSSTSSSLPTNKPSTSTSTSTSTSLSSSSSTSSSTIDDLPWVEKHRPRVLSDIVGNKEAVERLAIIAKQGNMPNIILSAGTGKTTSIVCLAREMLGPEKLESGLLELNASDARGIDVVRSKIKMFAQKKVTLPPGKHKIIILDEADSMTPSAQQALRRTMEIYSHTTRFALACNMSSKIIEPIQSRCAILRYSKLDDYDILRRIKEVMFAEGVTQYTNDGLEAILFTAQGDMRHALNNLQATYTGLGSITAENVFKVVDQPHPTTMTSILASCHSADLRTALYDLKSLTDQGYAAIDLIGTLFRVCKNSDIPDKKKLLYIKEISYTHMRIADGVDTPLQLAGLLARLSNITRQQQATT